ncbi:GNAT family N-acetyltransferase, partial [Aeromonas salmonicida]|uniref:GNAT family N-acetyltransferase n=1 Tax=Aeromonas salmonicida TaxID=645 RepID=UPI001F0004C4
ENAATIAGMLEHADLLVTAWSGEELVGVARSVTDFHYCCYLSDLAVADEMQTRGIGKALIRHTLEALHQGCQADPACRPPGHRVLPQARL